MGCTSAEFHRLLPGVGDVEYDAAENQFSHVEDDRCWSLRLMDSRERAIGALRLPVVDVALRFRGYARADIDAVMARFFAHFSRGGG